LPEKLAYAKKYLSNNKDKSYVIPIESGKSKGADLVMGNGGLAGFYVRWDIYKEVGAPEVKNEDDLLNVLKMMQDKHPKAENGKKVYALSSWNDWGTWPYWVPYGFSYGVQNINNGAMMNVLTGDTEMMYGDTFWKGMNFWNKAYKMGLFDPEGFTMKNPNYLEKVKAGQVLTQYAQWWVNEVNLALNPGLKDPNGKGFQLLMGLPVISEIYQIPNPVGNSGAAWATAISSSSKHADRAMKFIDFMNSDEGARLYYSGIKGKQWDVIDGKPQLTKEMIDLKNTDSKWGNTLGMIGIGHYNGVTGAHILADGYPADLALIKDMVMANLKDKEFDKDYTKHYGVDSGYMNEMWDKLVKDGKYKTKTRVYNYPNLVSAISDDASKATQKADEYMKTFLPKIVMAKSADAFEKAKKEALDQLNKIGYDKASVEILKLLTDAREKAKAEGLE
jgi:putative aldouronate transport system substrate-binding protein